MPNVLPTMASVLIQNIQQLLLANHSTPALAKGKEMVALPTLEHAYLWIEEGRIKSYGAMADCPELPIETIDATGRLVLPAWCDSHTHLVFAASREGEFVDRIRGLSYVEIAAKGGGILNSARKLQDTPAEKLLEDALRRLEEVRSMGTGAIEIKSGYGLSVEGELKMLRVIQSLKSHSDLPIKATFLGAHALPLAYKTNRSAYIDLIIQDMLPVIADEGLADYIDVFCEKGFFSPEETDQLLEAGTTFGLRPKIHTNQFNCMGGIQVAIKHDALSVDHLEVVNTEEITALQNSSTMATLLPSAPFFLSDPYQPARDLIDAGIPVALASDYNPGSSPSGNMSLVVALACIKLGMLPEEAIQAATLNGAYAMELQDEVGSISPGKRANVIITKPVPSIAYLPYAFGSNLIERVLINGK
jgi:imidazolonepropionase